MLTMNAYVDQAASPEPHRTRFLRQLQFTCSDPSGPFRCRRNCGILFVYQRFDSAQLALLASDCCMLTSRVVVPNRVLTPIEMRRGN